MLNLEGINLQPCEKWQTQHESEGKRLSGGNPLRGRCRASFITHIRKTGTVSVSRNTTTFMARDGGTCRNPQTSHHYHYGRKIWVSPTHVQVRRCQSSAWDSDHLSRSKCHLKGTFPELVSRMNSFRLYWKSPLVHSIINLGFFDWVCEIISLVCFLPLRGCIKYGLISPRGVKIQ